MKELHSYEKEVEREAAKTADMKEKGADPCDLKQQMPPFSRVRDASRVRMRKIANGGQPSSAPPVDEEVNSYVGKPFEGNPIYDEVGALHASILSDSTPLHHSPSGSIPPASAAPQGNIPVPPQNPPPPLPAYQAYRPPPPDYYPPLCYAPPPAGDRGNIGGDDPATKFLFSIVQLASGGKCGG